MSKQVLLVPFLMRFELLAWISTEEYAQPDKQLFGLTHADPIARHASFRTFSKLSNDQSISNRRLAESACNQRLSTLALRFK